MPRKEWLELILQKYVDQEMPHIKECTQCEDGCQNLAICVLMCHDGDMGLSRWYERNKEIIKLEYEKMIEGRWSDNI